MRLFTLLLISGSWLLAQPPSREDRTKLAELLRRTSTIQFDGEFYPLTVFQPGVTMTSFPGRGLVVSRVSPPQATVECYKDDAGKEVPCNLSRVIYRAPKVGERIIYVSTDVQPVKSFMPDKTRKLEIHSSTSISAGTVRKIEKSRMEIDLNARTIRQNGQSDVCGAAIYLENYNKPELVFLGMEVCDVAGKREIVPVPELLRLAKLN